MLLNNDNLHFFTIYITNYIWFFEGNFFEKSFEKVCIPQQEEISENKFWSLWGGFFSDIKTIFSKNKNENILF